LRILLNQHYGANSRLASANVKNVFAFCKVYPSKINV
jgi:hypothetical protein